MKYSTQEYEAAIRELNRRKKAAEDEQKKRHEEVASALPEILIFEKEMSEAGLSAIKALGMGKEAADYIDRLRSVSLESQKKRKELLVKNGYPEDYLQVHYHCPECSDKGFVDGKMCKCHKLILRALAYKKLCGNYSLDKYTFESFNLGFYPDGGEKISPKMRMKSVYEFCKSYAEDFSLTSPSLLMHGGTGLGKTHLSLAIAGKVINKDFGVIYASAQNLLNRLENEKFGRTGTAGTETALLDCDLLILDDLGTEFSTQFTVSAIYNIINSRLLSGKPTVISTNLSPKEFEQVYSQRIASRVLSEYVPLFFDGNDVRQIKTRI